jgi:hypothetical protein
MSQEVFKCVQVLLCNQPHANWNSIME